MNRFSSRFLRILFLVLFLPLVLYGCRVPNITVDQKGGKNVFVKGAVMERFPPVPLYPKAQIIESYSTDENYGASAISDEELDKVVEFYRQNFVQLGWESSLIRQTVNNYLFEFKSQEYRGSVTVNLASDNKKTAITVTVSPRQ